MKIKVSGAKYSNIVSIAELIKKLEKETGKEYLPLNRGINAVVNIDLSEVIKQIDFNSSKLQVYPPNNGFEDLKQAINTEFFGGHAQNKNIVVTHGGMGALDIVLGMLDVPNVYFAKYYWGSYRNVAIIHKVNYDTYDSYAYLAEHAAELRDCAVIINDPNNPLGDKWDDAKILDLIKTLDQNGVITLFDCPYRKLFSGDNDTMYQELLKYPSVVVLDSFSKAFGISGQRVSFIHCQKDEFIHELGVKMLYIANGVNAFAQELVTKLITTPEGKKATADFRKTTVEHIAKNIAYLEKRGLLAMEYYKDSMPLGIFVIVNKTEQELLKHRIGSVGLSYFTGTDKEYADKFARICVSVPHDKFVAFFDEVV